MATTPARKGKFLRWALSAALIVASSGSAWADDNLSPYKMLRSLQYLQDSVVLGDHSVGDMQRFMIDTIDNRLRTANSEVFEEPRNADAAIVYAMSGGNPKTLDYLVARDIQGHFDSRVVTVLQKYFNGKGAQVGKSVAELAKEYRNTPLGPYLFLVAGNIAASVDPAAAMGFFDEARLGAPGTIVEEAALRRSVVASLGADAVEKALSYSRRYARRFLYSPYSSQFADLFVELVVKHYGTVSQDDIADILGLMDTPRAQEILLRISRQGSLRGNLELARHAAAEAQRLGGLLEDGSGHPVLPRLYEGVASVSTSDIVSAIDTLSGISDQALSERDKALKDAARAVAEQILEPPSPAGPSLSTSPEIVVPTQAEDAATADATSRQRELPDAAQVSGQEAVGTGPADEPVMDFVKQSRGRLDQIDALLLQEGSIE